MRGTPFSYYASVFAGAGAGACLRWRLTVLAGHFFPGMTHLGTLASNLASCFLVGVVAAVLAIKTSAPPEWRLFFITGFCGGLSTLSALSLETLDILEGGDRVWQASLPAMGNLFMNVAGSLALCWLGMSAARKALGG